MDLTNLISVFVPTHIVRADYDPFIKNEMIVETIKQTHEKLNLGDAFCFSGNHIHGSNLGAYRRLNIETRTLCVKDVKKFHLPKNIDNKNLVKQGKWFRSLFNSKFYIND